MFFAEKRLSLKFDSAAALRLMRAAAASTTFCGMRHIYKYLLTTLLLTAAALPLRAQTMSAAELFPEDAGRRRMRLRTEWSVMGGATIAGWSADVSSISFDSKAGYHAGFDIALLLDRRCAVVPELRFTHTAVNIAGAAGYVQRVRNNALEMPLMFEYRILRGRLRFHAGPSFTLMDRSSTAYRNDDTLDLTGTVRVRPTVTYVVGVRGVIGRRVTLGVRFNGQFNRTEQFIGLNADDSDFQTYRMGGWRLSLSAGYRF